MTDDFGADRFHCCAIAAGFMAACEGRLDDSGYVRRLAYQGYEEGAFADEARRGSQPAN
jgi:hypothetical protein